MNPKNLKNFWFLIDLAGRLIMSSVGNRKNRVFTWIENFQVQFIRIPLLLRLESPRISTCLPL
jgi:hypothetical protein